MSNRSNDGRTEVAALRMAANERAGEVERLRATLASREKYIANMQLMYGQLQGENERLRAQLRHRGEASMVVDVVDTTVVAVPPSHTHTVEHLQRLEVAARDTQRAVNDLRTLVERQHVTEATNMRDLMRGHLADVAATFREGQQEQRRIGEGVAALLEIMAPQQQRVPTVSPPRPQTPPPPPPPPPAPPPPPPPSEGPEVRALRGDVAALRGECDNLRRLLQGMVHQPPPPPPPAQMPVAPLQQQHYFYAPPPPPPPPPQHIQVIDVSSPPTPTPPVAARPPLPAQIWSQLPHGSHAPPPRMEQLVHPEGAPILTRGPSHAPPPRTERAQPPVDVEDTLASHHHHQQQHHHAPLRTSSVLSSHSHPSSTYSDPEEIIPPPRPAVVHVPASALSAPLGLKPRVTVAGPTTPNARPQSRNDTVSPVHQNQVPYNSTSAFVVATPQHGASPPPRGVVSPPKRVRMSHRHAIVNE